MEVSQAVSIPLGAEITMSGFISPSVTAIAKVIFVPSVASNDHRSSSSLPRVP